MAPVEADALASTWAPLSQFAAQAIASPVLIGVIARFLAKAQDDLPPAYRTRYRTAKYRRQVTVFSFLTAISYLITAYHALTWRLASYNEWAAANKIHKRGTIWDGGWFVGNEQHKWELARWTREVNLGAVGNLALVDSSLPLWWSSQQAVGLIVWSVFVGLECRHRNIPQHISYAFILLAQIGGLSTAVGLFFVALTVTHVPLSPAGTTNRGGLLTAHPIVLLVPALWSFIFIFYLPWVKEHGLYTALSNTGYFIVPLLLCALAQPNYLHKVTEHMSPRAARQSHTAVFRVLSWASIMIHALRSVYAILDTAPASYSLHHDYVWNMHDYAHTSYLHRGLAVLAQILGTLHSNPIVSQAAWDVLMTEAALFAWAASRGLDVRAMLRSAGLLWTKEDSEAIKRAAKGAAEKLEEVESEAEEEIKTIEDEFEEIINAASSATDDATHKLRQSARKAAGTIKEKTGLGDGNTNESAAQKSKSRPRKSTLESSTSTPSKSSNNTLTRRNKQSRDSAGVENEHDDVEDPEFEPTPGVERQVQKMGVLPEHDEDIIDETEAAGLSWGLFAFGGLGVACAGVLGAEVGGGR